MLANLAVELPISQLQLQKLRILSPLLLLKTPKVHRLHETVPHKVPIPQPQIDKPAPAAPHKRSPSPELSDPEQQEEPKEQVNERIVPSTVPANITTRWTDEGVQLVRVNPQMTHQDAYQVYLKRCKELGRPARTFAAFKRKRRTFHILNFIYILFHRNITNLRLNGQVLWIMLKYPLFHPRFNMQLLLVSTYISWHCTYITQYFCHQCVPFIFPGHPIDLQLTFSSSCFEVQVPLVNVSFWGWGLNANTFHHHITNVYLFYFQIIGIH